MATRSAIFIRTTDGDWLCHYCHNDGHPRWQLGALTHADPDAILAAQELRQIRSDGTLDAFDDPRQPERMAQPEMPEWAEHAYILGHRPDGWRHATTTDALKHWAEHATA